MMKWWMEKYKQDKRNKTEQEQENDNLALRAAFKLGMKFVLQQQAHLLELCSDVRKINPPSQNMMSQQKKSDLYEFCPLCKFWNCS